METQECDRFLAILAFIQLRQKFDEPNSLGRRQPRSLRSVRQYVLLELGLSLYLLAMPWLHSPTLNDIEKAQWITRMMPIAGQIWVSLLAYVADSIYRWRNPDSPVGYGVLWTLWCFTCHYMFLIYPYLAEPDSEPPMYHVEKYLLAITPCSLQHVYYYGEVLPQREHMRWTAITALIPVASHLLGSQAVALLPVSVLQRIPPPMVYSVGYFLVAIVLHVLTLPTTPSALSDKHGSSNQSQKVPLRQIALKERLLTSGLGGFARWLWTGDSGWRGEWVPALPGKSYGFWW